MAHTPMTPLPPGYDATTAARQLDVSGHKPFRTVIDDLNGGLVNQRDVGHAIVVLDWAAQLRAQGMPWSDALEAASIAYYG